MNHLSRFSFFAVATPTTVALTAVTALASTMLSLELDQLVDEADHIVVATAVSEEVSRDDRGRIVTDVTVSVEERLKGEGEANDTLVVRVHGGTIGDLVMRTSGEPQLVTGSRYVMFLRDRDERCRAVGMSQGVLTVRDGDAGPMVHPRGGGLRLVQRSGDRLVPGAPAVLHPIPLGELLDSVKAELASSASATQ